MKRIIEEIEIAVAKKARTDDDASQMMLVKPSEVPEYLRESEFFRSLDKEEDGPFAIPAGHMKPNTAVEVVEDACELLRTVSFWGSNISLIPVFDYAITQPVSEIETELRPFEEVFSFIKAVLHVSQCKDSVGMMIGAAMECGNMEIIRHLDNRATDSNYSEDTVISAARGGSMECLLHAQNKVSYDKKAPFDAVSESVVHGNLDCLKLLYQQYFDDKPYVTCQYMQQIKLSELNKLTKAATEHGQLKCLQYLCEEGAPLYGCASLAAETDDAACLKVIVDQDHSYLYLKDNNEVVQLYSQLVSKGCECLKLVHELKPDWLVEVCLDAAERGDLQRLQQYIDLGGNWHIFTCHAAALNGNLNCLQFACENGSPVTVVAEHLDQLNVAFRRLFQVNDDISALVTMVAQRMYWDCARCLILHDYPLNERLTDQLALHQQRDLLRLAMEHGCPMSLEVSLHFARVGDLESLTYVIEHLGGAFHPWVGHAAALHGHLSCLQFAIEKNCPMLILEDNARANSDYCQYFKVNELPWKLVAMVAQRKHWACARYLILQKHPLTPGLTPQLAYNKQDDLLRLAVEHGCPLPTEVAVIYARRGYLEGLQFVMERGCKPTSQIPWGAARCGRLSCLVYAHEHGCLLDEFVCVGAARGGHLDCLQYAFAHNCRWGQDVCKAAVKGGSAECVQYARENVLVEEDEETSSSGSGEEER